MLCVDGKGLVDTAERQHNDMTATCAFASDHSFVCLALQSNA